MEAAQHPWPALGVLLLRDGLVEREELEALLDEQRDERQHRISGWRLGEILVKRGRVTEEQVARLVAEQYELPYVELDEGLVDMRVADRLPAELVDRFTALPIELLDDGSALVAVSDPATVLFSDELRKALGMPIHFTVTSSAALSAAIAVARNPPRAEAAAPSPAWPSGSPALDVVRHEDDTLPSTSSSLRSAASAAAPDTGILPPLGALLVRDGLVSEDELEAALAQQRLSTNKRLGEILVERSAVTRADIARIVAEQYELPFLDVAEHELDPEVTGLIPHELATRYAAIPLKRQPDGSLLVAVADPTTILDPGELSSELGATLSFAVADPDVIESALQRRPPEPLAQTRTETDDAEEDETPPGLSAAPVPGTVVRLDVADPPVETPDPLDGLLESARDLGATALRLSPSRDGIVVLATVEGGDRELDALRDTDTAAVARALRENQALEVVLLPTLRGDVVHVRFTSDPAPLPMLAELGFDEAAEGTLRSALAERSGLVLFSGPTATTYAFVQELTSAGRSVLTIEDSIERALDGVDQIEAGPETGLTVAQGLRRILRAEPDAVLVNETADRRTADLVARGAERALVLTTVRAHTAPDAVRRLVALGADPSVLASTLRAAVAQCAVRRICVECRASHFASLDEVATLGLPGEDAGRRLLGVGRGCERCGWTGFEGRVELHEVVPVSAELRAWVANGAAAEGEPAPVGGSSIRDAVVRLCLDGLTTVFEARRGLGLPGAS